MGAWQEALQVRAVSTGDVEPELQRATPAVSLGRPASYALAVVGALAAVALRLLLAEYLGTPYMLFYPLVAVVAYLGGYGPGILATLLSGTLTAVLILPLEPHRSAWSAREVVALAAYAAVALLLTVAAVRFRDSRRKRNLLDVVTRARAQAALEESRNRLRLLVEFAPAAIAMLDRDMRYIAASRRYLLDYRLATAEVLGRSHYELFPEIPERWRELHRRCLAGAVERCEEDPFPRPDGRTDWVRWEIRPWRDAAGEVGGLILFSEVITERKEMEARVSQAERLAAVATLVRGMSHEMNNPLAAVVNNVHFALEHRALQADLREALTDAAAGADRIKGIVRAMNAFASTTPLAERWSSPSAVLRRAVALAAHALAGCAEVSVDVPDLPAVAVGEEELLQVYVNLLANAGQATGSAPNHVRVTGALASRDRVVVSIADTGVGMPPEVLARVFEPFFTTRGLGGGKGLGLSICKGLIDAAGGELAIRSAPGAGTGVTLTLPVSTAASLSPRT